MVVQRGGTTYRDTFLSPDEIQAGFGDGGYACNGARLRHILSCVAMP
jgi:hypothetical protein